VNDSSVTTRDATARLPGTKTFFLLMAATFGVSMGYGVILPLLPLELQRLVPGVSAATSAWHTGMLAGIYMFAIFLFAPLWGHVSDRIGRRPVILCGLAGYAFTLPAFALSPSLGAAYATRAAAGALASAVMPITAAFVSETAAEERRARRLAWIGASSLAGFLVGPAAGGWLAKMGQALDVAGMPVGGMILPPLYISGFFVSLVWAGLYLLLPSAAVPAIERTGGSERNGRRARGRFLMLLALNLLITYGLGSFEVGVALQARQQMGLDPGKLATMFAECSLVMIVVEIVLFATPVKNLSGRPLVVPAFLAVAVAFVLLPAAQNFFFMLFVVGLIAASTGILLPALTHLVSLQSVLRIGAALGLQAALSSLGQAMGSAAAGALYGLVAGRLFWISAALMGLGAAVAAVMLRPAPLAKAAA